MKHLLGLLLFVTFYSGVDLYAQADYVIIDEVILDGNKRTKDGIILRELDLFAGDTLYYADTSQWRLENEKRILSTGLFTNVAVDLGAHQEDNRRDVVIDIQENWYIYPNFIFDLADRNFSVWWNEQNRSLDRVNYGFRLNHINLTGNRDNLRLTTQFGFTKKFELDYSYPYLDKQQKLGIATNVTFTENREIGFETIGNKTVFHREGDERILLRRFRSSIALNYRQDLFQYHSFKVEYHRNGIDDFVATELNQDYFLNGEDAIRFFTLDYDYSIDKRIFSFYPEGGFLFGVNTKKEGLGIFGEYDNLFVELRGEYYTQPVKNLIFANQLKLKTNINRRQVAFANNTGLGYNGNVVSGYELYVVDGTDFLLNKSSIRWKAIDNIVNLNKLMPLQQFKLMDFKLYLTFNFDVGYVNEPTYVESNFLNNQWLVGFGPGIDMLLFNTHLFSFEYSFNELGESGLFLSNRVSF